MPLPNPLQKPSYFNAKKEAVFYRNPKIALIGGGNIGNTMAHLIVAQNLADTVIVDIAEDVPQGKALDHAQAAAIAGEGSFVYGSNDYADIAGSDVIIITAGIARKPGMSRDDLISVNAGIIETVGQSVKEYAPHAHLICITNPLDAMVYRLWKASGLPAERVTGMAGILDSGRMRCFLAEHFNVSARDVSAFVLGGHGDTMVPLPRLSTVAGIPLPVLQEMGKITADDIDAICQRTAGGGGEVVQYLKTGSAFIAPATAAVQMATSILHNERRIFPCAAYVEDAYGITKGDGLFFGVPVILGGNGVEEIINVPLNQDEQAALDVSIQAVRDLCGLTDEILGTA